MLEEVKDNIIQLKNLVSLRYVDPPMREEYFSIISELQIDHKSVHFCSDYVTKIQQSHEKMMEEVSNFLNLLSPSINDLQRHIENLQLELSQQIKVHQHEVQEHINHQKYLGQKLHYLSAQIQKKDEQIRQINIRLEEREVFLEDNEREECEYLNKIQKDFEKQQKALEEALNIITQKEEEIERLENQIFILQETKIQERSAEPAILIVSNQNEGESSKKESPLRHHSDDECSLVQCSLVSSDRKSEGLQQFEELRFQSQVQESQEMQVVQRPQTLRQMLNLSLQKEYKMQYNKCDSVEQKSKQNCPKNWARNSKSKSQEKKLGWINKSLQLMEKNQIKEFKLPQLGSKMKKNNPYYHYFLIACQNVKIRSKHFQVFSKVATDSQWEHLNRLGIPLHQWQNQIEAFLIKQCSLIQ